MEDDKKEEIREAMRKLDPSLEDVDDATLDIYIELAESLVINDGFEESDELYYKLITIMAVYYATSNSDMLTTNKKKVGDVEIEYGSYSTSDYGNKWLDLYERLTGSYDLTYVGID